MRAVEVRDLSFSFRNRDAPDVPILKQVSFSVNPGELVAIQGPSGSGKSTLLYILGALLRSYTGSVRIFGEDPAQMDELRLAFFRNRTIGFIFQQFHLLPKQTALENVSLPQEYPMEALSGENEIQHLEKAKGILTRLGLSDRMHHYPNQLSGGQQQRVAIARALIRDPKLILADEPTGSLDSKQAQDLMDLLKRIRAEGCTVIVITHDADVARQCDRIIALKDGKIESGVQEEPATKIKDPELDLPPVQSRFTLLRKFWKTGVASLRYNRRRTALTLLGIIIGIAAVFSMVTVGSFTKRKILESYAENGVNVMTFYGQYSWKRRARDTEGVPFQGFHYQKDLVAAKKLFSSDIFRLSPLYSGWDNKITFSGRTEDQDVAVHGISEDGFSILRRSIQLGRDISLFDVEESRGVCVIGYDVFQRLFMGRDPIGEVVFINQQISSFGCRVIGVLARSKEGGTRVNSNLLIAMPFTYYEKVSDPWSRRLSEFLIETYSSADVEAVGKKLEAFFKLKYGNSGQFSASADSVLVSQMEQFLGLFSVLLAGIALVSLAVGGIGITNMMLVAVNERLREIGIRKAFGATRQSVRMQFLMESVILCALAGGIGIVLGGMGYELAIWGASQMTSKVSFEWVFDPVAFALSCISIVGVGIGSGLSPALKAERLEVIEALRSE